MGFYIETGTAKLKPEFLANNHDAKFISQDDAKDIVTNGSDDLGVICIVDNGPFEAAAFCHSADEFTVFSDHGDRRPKRWMTMNKQKAIELSGCKPGFVT